MQKSALLSKLRGADEGVTAIEYALLAAMIALGIIAGARLTGTSTQANFNNMGSTMQATSQR
ncbi:MAG TPA: Flp family type IVb pilin [Polyangiales bacterium]|nr:Flp family type IVb pilin [Polyangiales bacterium]